LQSTTSSLDTQCRSDFPVLERRVRDDKVLVYLDNAATTQKPIQVIDAITDYYKNHKVILGLAWVLQVCLIGNLFVFFHGELLSLKVLGRFIMLAVMAPMVISENKRVHEIGMGVFFVGFIYTIIKYHIFIEG